MKYLNSTYKELFYPEYFCSVFVLKCSVTTVNSKHYFKSKMLNHKTKHHKRYWSSLQDLNSKKKQTQYTGLTGLNKLR